MKKLMLKLEGKEMLSKEQMKKINGGYLRCKINGTGYPSCEAPQGWYWQDMSGYNDNCTADHVLYEWCTNNSECCLDYECGCDS